MEPIILVHGGAGDIPSDRVPGKIAGVKLAVKEGYKILSADGTAVDAVEAAVRSMEDDENFNAGYGSVLNLDGKVEMEASIMNGIDLNVGGCTLVTDIANPITLARRVMEQTPHSLLGGNGAARFAKEQGIPTVLPETLITKFAKQALENFKKTGYVRTEIGATDNTTGDLGGTVGAVAIDKFGNIAAATSTGGMSGKYVGRIGDTPQIGSGTYADNDIGAVSTTGHGETILKYCLAHKIITQMEVGKIAQEATQTAVENMTRRLKNTAGAITLSKTGQIGVHFSSQRMAWAYSKDDEIHFGIEHGQDDKEAV